MGREEEREWVKEGGWVGGRVRKKGRKERKRENGITWAKWCLRYGHSCCSITRYRIGREKQNKIDAGNFCTRAPCNDTFQ